MVPLNYHQLYYFWRIAKAGSLTSGSRDLLLAVPTLSLQLSQLERALGLRLFDRDRRGVTLTAGGREVFEHCERIFSEGEALLSFLRSGPRGVPPPLRLGVQDSISAWLVLRIIEFVGDVDPSVRVSVYGGSQSELQERLRRHALDAVVANFDYSVALGHDFASRLVAKIPVSFVGTPAIRRQIRRFPRDLHRVPLLAASADNPIRRLTDAYLREHRVRPRIEIEIENSLLIRLLAVRGRGAAVVDTLTVNEDLKAGRLVPLHRAATRMEEYVWLLYDARPKSHPSLLKVMGALVRDFSISL